eukprot:CAMPEP_0114982990 /NCGR_PEP_ID=MMETSP0216-20121206/6442_1 /TAXON_ID=223996 /ORGANISM="Protocruzia adherens, Strain Boccale" /LENGTH=474 /DNA_ID=CAMNT_0002344905 /DNA_START=25 /DNA_END=1449 /DNA_ORIENTATION=-
MVGTKTKSSDPLQLLRDYTISKKPIILKDQKLNFGSSRFDLNQATPWKSVEGSKHYTLGALWLFLEHHKDGVVNLGRYLEGRKQLGVEIVSAPDRTSIKDYFSGKVDTTDCIDEAFRAEIIASRTVKRQKTGSTTSVITSQVTEYSDSQSHTKSHSQTPSSESKPSQMTQNSSNPTSLSSTASKSTTTPKPTHTKPTNSHQKSSHHHHHRHDGHEERKHDLRKSVQVVLGLERTLENKQTLFHNPRRGYKDILDAFKEMNKSSQAAMAASSRAGSSGQQGSAGAGNGSAGSSRRSKSLLDDILSMKDANLNPGRPIIVVPSSCQQGNIALNNAKKFLNQGVYEDSLGLKEKGYYGPSRKDYFTRRVRGKDVTFEIYDEVDRFEEHHWRRVIAVFVHNPNWQFKKWRDGNNLVATFVKYKAFFLRYADTATPDYISRFNIKVFEIQRNKRYLDKPIQNTFWELLEGFLGAERPQV